MGVPSDLTKFQWQPQPAAQKLINELVADFLSQCPEADHLSKRMRAETGTRFNDWIDHIQAPASKGLTDRLAATGFRSDPLPGAPRCFVHDGAIFPRIVLTDSPVRRVGIKVDSVVDFMVAQRVPSSRTVEGEPGSQLRRGVVFVGQGAELVGIERHGYLGFDVPAFDAGRAVRAARHLEALRRRDRDFDDDAKGVAHVHALVDAAVADLGKDLACDLFFEAERRYWGSRNRAAQVQKARQDKLGLGWANHDHHTYRSSRGKFTGLISLWEKLGFRPRERFYAGAEAGWGAQVMEQVVTGITTFNDVDMSPEELLGDFAHVPMPERKELGTVGLWCGLHGEALLQAGMHHLECQFDWHALVEQLESTAHIKTMAPFTTFPFLRQAFTEGERWEVSPRRLERLVAAGSITPAQAEQFRVQGALGSHLENLERNDGYKGFNQQGVSDIIARTDPRRQSVLAAS